VCTPESLPTKTPKSTHKTTEDFPCFWGVIFAATLSNRPTSHAKRSVKGNFLIKVSSLWVLLGHSKLFFPRDSCGLEAINIWERAFFAVALPHHDFRGHDNVDQHCRKKIQATEKTTEAKAETGKYKLYLSLCEN
jgi:hypothetical protein